MMKRIIHSYQYHHWVSIIFDCSDMFIYFLYDISFEAEHIADTVKLSFVHVLL